MGQGHVAGPCLGTTAEESESKKNFKTLTLC